MRYVEYKPIPSLQPYISCFWTMESEGEACPVGQDRTLPDGCLEIILHLGEPMQRRLQDNSFVREDRCKLIGQTTRPYLFTWSGQVRMLGIRFFPHTAYLFVNEAVHRFNDRAVELGNVLVAWHRFPLARMEDATTMRETIGLVEDYFSECLAGIDRDTAFGYLDYACRKILQLKGNVSVKVIAAELGITSRYLEKLCRERIGMSPKLLARITRFQNSLQYLGHDLNLAAVAQHSAYFDQAHFVRDFRLLAGITPRRYQRELHPISAHFANPVHSSYLYNYR